MSVTVFIFNKVKDLQAATLFKSKLLHQVFFAKSIYLAFTLLYLLNSRQLCSKYATIFNMIHKRVKLLISYSMNNLSTSFAKMLFCFFLFFLTLWSL